MTEARQATHRLAIRRIPNRPSRDAATTVEMSAVIVSSAGRRTSPQREMDPTMPQRGRSPRPHRSFALVLGGGGARGYAHVGVLRGLELLGYEPGALVGVSMGAVVAASRALREDWYAALMGMDTRSFPSPLAARDGGTPSWAERWRGWWALARAGWDMFLGWGVGSPAVPGGMAVLREVTGGRRLEDASVPVAVAATDLRSGERVVLTSGDAAEALYASAALAGVLPPQRRGKRLLVDGAYADIAPVDIADEFGLEVVIAVDPGQALQTRDPRTGYEALLRAVEVCQMTHAHLRFAEADLVLRPLFRRTIDTLEFDARRECVAAGLRAVHRHRGELSVLLEGNRVRGNHPFET